MPPVTEDLSALLSTVLRPGDFATSGRADLLAPRIEVNSVGPIALPLLPAQARDLIAAAERAPYGRGPDTLVDTNVRRAWQIAPERVLITGKHWPRTLDDIVARAAEGLGVSGAVTAELYKLLVYEEGDFFVAHRDTEKAAGMFATLVVALPSLSSGGEVLVRHNGREASIDLQCEEPSEIAFAAFYADCVHEVRPIASGHRAVLVYNMIRAGDGPRPEPPSYEREVAEAAALLRRWAEDVETWRQYAAAHNLGDHNEKDDDDGNDEEDETAPDAPPLKLLHLLEHAYTPAELGFDALKGADAAVAGVLKAAAPQAACDLHLALLTIEESGLAQHVGRRHWGSYEPEMEAVEVYDRTEALGDWRRPDGAPSPLTPLPIEEDEVSPPGALADVEPDEEHFHEATGNEGASFERTYRRAALVLWPRAQTLAVINRAGIAATLPYLDDLVAKWRDAGAKSSSPLWREARALTKLMLATWSARPQAPWDAELSDAARMLPLVARLKDKAGVDAFLGKLIAQAGHAKADNEAVLEALVLFSPDKAAARLERLVTASAATTPGPCAALLAAALARFGSERALLRDAASALVEALPGDPKREPKDDWGRPRPAVVDVDLVVDLARALDAVDAGLAQRAGCHLLDWPKRYDLDAVLVPAGRRLIAADSTIRGEAHRIVHAASLAHLKARAAEPLEPPQDWSRPNDVACRCEHCTELGAFLVDPEESAWRLKAAQRFRDHVEGTIRTARCDVDTRTERRGSPHTLVCTKNQATYQRRVAQRKRDLADIATLDQAPKRGR